MTDTSSTRCIACYEPIHSDASVCHHCGTSQIKHFWASLGGVLKWVGGVTAILSLVAGSLQLNSLYKDWKKNQNAVDNYLVAARHQLNSGDFQSAQLLLQEAVKLDPASGEVRDVQIDFLMKQLRTYYPTHNSRNVEVLKIINDDNVQADYKWVYKSNMDEIRDYFKAYKADQLLALGVATSSGKRKADILAHVAWLDILTTGPRTSSELNKLFKHALQIDGANPYAHLFQSAWNVSQRNGQNHSDTLAMVLDHYSVIGSPNDSIWPWIKSMQFKILMKIGTPQAFIEVLRLAEEDNNEVLFHSVADDILSRLNVYIKSSDNEIKENGSARFLQLHNAYSDEELLKLTIRLSEKVFGCKADQQCYVFDSFVMYNIMGFLYERTGDDKKALAAYRMYQWLHVARWSTIEEPLFAALKRTMASNNVSFSQVLVVRGQGSKPDMLKASDLIYRYDGFTNFDRDRIREISKSDSDTTNNIVDLVRDGKYHHSVNIGDETISHPNTYKSLIVPIELVSDKTMPERTWQLYKAWVPKELGRGVSIVSTYD